MREEGEQLKRCGNNLALLGAAGWATRLGREVAALAGVSQLDACSACCLGEEAGSEFFGEPAKTRVVEEIGPLAVRRGFCM